MVNRQTRNPGEIRQYQPQAQVGGQLPSAVVDENRGSMLRTLEAVGANLGDRLKVMADRAASAEGAQAGIRAGQAAGEPFRRKAAGDRAAAARKNPPPPPAPAPPGGPAQPAGLSSTPLQLRNDNTIYGRAFDEAAIKTFGWRMQAALSTELMEAAQANADSPGGYESAIGKIRAAYLGTPELANPELREVFERQFTERVAPSRLAIRARAEARAAAALRTAAIDGVKAMTTELERDAYNLGANPVGGWLMSDKTKRALTAIDAGVEDGTFSAAEGVKLKRGITDTVRNARTEGTFAALPTPEAKQQFALSIMEDWSKGTGAFADLDLDAAKSLSDTLYRRATAEQSRLTAETRAEQASVKQLIADDIASIAASGEGLDLPGTGLSTDRVRTLLGEDGLKSWADARLLAGRQWEATAGMELETEAEIGARLEALKPEPGAAGFVEAQAIYESARKRANDVIAERRADPLGQAATAGLIELAPLDWTSGEALVSSIGKRRAAALTVAETYGTPLAVFRPQERAALAQGLLDQPELLPGFSLAVATQFGDIAPRVLGELSEAGPELAQAAGIAMATGNTGVAADLATALAMKRDKAFKAKLPEGAQMTRAASAILGNALSANESQRAAVLGTANLLFELDANRMGFDPRDVADPGSAAHAAYARAIDRALGMQMIEGVAWGGRTLVNDRMIVAPSFLPASSVQDLLGGLSDMELAQLPPILSGNGVPVSAGQLQGARLVTVGDGLYRLALGDPDSFDPQYVATPDGDYWELDMRELAALRARRVRIPGLLPFGLGDAVVTMPVAP